MTFTIGSLFDGSGGFPLAAFMCGGVPLWASEIEPYPIAVTKTRFPYMKHLGDISKINGTEIEPVDVITFGSPCQDLSVAGKRAGLKHEVNGDEETTRSGLFMEAVRIIKEMRDATDGKYPRIALWENVPGAFSSNKGEDFRVVLEELIKIVEPGAVMPEVPKKGWAYADSYSGDGWSLAYRVFDAQYWGVPQRRRRIYLVLDLGGGRAGEILFEREGLRGHFEKGRTPWQGAAANAEGRSGVHDSEGERIVSIYDARGNGDGQTVSTLTGDHENRITDYSSVVCEPIAFAQNQRDEVRSLGDKAGSLQAQPGMKQQTFIIDSIGGQAEAAKETDVRSTLKATNYKFPPCVPHAAGFCTEHSANSRGIGYQNEVAPTLRAGVTPAVMYNQDADSVIDVEMEVAVRKHEVDQKKLVELLRSHKGDLSNREISEMLGKPLTMVEHWFRTDDCFAIPDPDVWYALKELLGIKTDEFDKPITEFEFKGGNYDLRNRIYTGNLSPTLTCGSGNALYLIPEEPVFCLQGNGIDRADTAGCNGKGWNDQSCYTLNTIDRPAVAYATDVGWLNTQEEVSPTLLARQYKDPHLVTYPAAYGVDCRNMNEYPDVYPTLQAKPNGGQSLNFSGAVRTQHTGGEPVMWNGEQVAPTLTANNAGGNQRMPDKDNFNAVLEPKGNCEQKYIRYIVRRLTPTECARLQGFPDRWGDIDPKEDFTEEEYQFWLDVRNTHAEINGKQVKEYTKKQMLTWYTKLHTDSSEYKLWGNGIALPTALYCMQGIAEALKQ